jgi:hypothetical protein
MLLCDITTSEKETINRLSEYNIYVLMESDMRHFAITR